MTVKEAALVLEQNCFAAENSFLYFLHEECDFKEEAFWRYYDCICVLAQEAVASGRNMDTAWKICNTYQRILQEFIAHFSPCDVVLMENFPPDYPEYIERLCSAVEAYFRGTFVKAELLSPKRPEP